MKIRIAVAVDSNGVWNAYGWGHGQPGEEIEDKGSMEEAIHGLESDVSARYFIEADVPLPQYSTIKGVVVEEKEEKIT